MPGRRRQPRLPFDPIDQLLEHQGESRWTVVERRDGQGNACYIAQRIGQHRSLIHRYRKDGLTPNMADRIAIALGRHPIEIWPDYHEVSNA